MDLIETKLNKNVKKWKKYHIGWITDIAREKSIFIGQDKLNILIKHKEKDVKQHDRE